MHAIMVSWCFITPREINVNVKFVIVVENGIYESKNSGRLSILILITATYTCYGVSYVNKV